MKKFWELKNLVEGEGSRLILEGPISSESWWGDEVTPEAFREELKNVQGDKLEVVINSPGGDVWAGISIHDALKELEAEVTVIVSGLAASIASVIAMAGDKIVITPGSTMMIHKASMFAMGNSDDLEKAIEMLATVETGLVAIYADRTGLSTEEVKDLLDAETWMDAERAVALGFADEVKKSVKEDQPEDTLANSFKGKLAMVMSAEKKAMNSFVSKVEASTDDDAEPEAGEPDPIEEPVVDDPTPEPETKPDTEVETDPVEENTKVKDTKKKETSDMTDEEKKKLADKAAKEAAAQAPGTEGIENKAKPTAPVKADNSNYLKSKKSIEDFANILVAQAGNTAQDVKDAWETHLSGMGITNGITNPDILLPDALITEIQDAFMEGGQIWNLVTKTGLTVFRAAWDTVTGENSRAGGYNRADEETKREEVITLDDRILRPQFIYKYITLNKEDIKENRDTGALVRYVLSELPRRIVREIERAIVIGDGRVDGSDYKIDSFVSVKEDAEGSDGFAVQYTPEADESKYESLLRARDLVKAGGAKWLVAKTGYLTDILLMETVSGGFMFAPGSDIPKALGFAGVIEPDWLDDTSDPENDAYIIVFSQYKTVGDNSIEAFTNFLLSTNKQEYLQEIYAGGALTVLKSAVAIGVAES